MGIRAVGTHTGATDLASTEQQSEQGDADSPLLSKLHATDVRTVRHFGEDEGPFGRGSVCASF